MKIMAVDLGDVRTGLAVCDRTEFLASPVGVIKGKNLNDVVMQVAHMAKEYEVGEIIVGHPLNMDGSAGARAQKSEEFAKKLNLVAELPVKLWDERNTTISATNYLIENNINRKKRKEIVDEVAATVILESYLKFRENQRDKQS